MAEKQSGETARQVIVIHGGDSFRSREDFLAFLRGVEIESVEKFKPRTDWKARLQDTLGDAYEVLLPRMPNKDNAQYGEWKIWFEKLLPFVRENALFIGHSLGGIFLAKYCAENTLPVHASGLFLVAAPFDEEDGEDLGDFTLPADISGIERQAERIFVYHSVDDPVVPVDASGKYQRALPRATLRIFKDRAHFNQEEFPEIINDIVES